MEQLPKGWYQTNQKDILMSKKGEALVYTAKEIIYWHDLRDPNPYARYPLTVSQKFLELVSQVHG